MRLGINIHHVHDAAQEKDCCISKRILHRIGWILLCTATCFLRHIFPIFGPFSAQTCSSVLFCLFGTYLPSFGSEKTKNTFNNVYVSLQGHNSQNTSLEMFPKSSCFCFCICLFVSVIKSWPVLYVCHKSRSVHTQLCWFLGSNLFYWLFAFGDLKDSFNRAPKQWNSFNGTINFEQ